MLQGSGPSNLDYDLQIAVTQGAVGARLTSGTQDVCTACTSSNGNDGTDGKKFLGKTCPVPIACL